MVRSPAAIVLVAFFLRVADIAVYHTYRVQPTATTWYFAAEMGRIAGSLASGHGFSSPFLRPGAAPSAWLGPVYPLLLAGVFKIFGLYSSTSAFVMLTINSVFGALTCLTILLIAREIFNEAVGLWAAWIWAVLPYAIFWPTHWIWETSLSTLLLSWVFLITLRMQGSARARQWAALGLLWGVIALTNASLLSFLPVSVAWLCYQLRGNRRLWLTRVAVLTLTFCVAVSPWVIRNYRVFGKFVFPRSDFGEELWAGNHEDGSGLYWLVKPWDWSKIQKLGELGYMDERRDIAMQFIRNHPREFTIYTLKRVGYFWCDIPQAGNLLPHFAMGSRHALYFAFAVAAFWGLWEAYCRKIRGAVLFAGLFAFYPLIYYVTHCHPRYQHPITPEMLLLGVFLVYSSAGNPSRVQAWWKKFRAREDRDRLAAVSNCSVKL